MCICMPVFIFLVGKYEIFNNNKNNLRNKRMDLIRAFIVTFIGDMFPTFSIISILISTMNVTDKQKVINIF